MKPGRIGLMSLTSVISITSLALLLGGFAQPALAADNDPSSRVARLNYVRGSVSFQPAGEPDWMAAVINRPITTGDRLWTDQGSRAEMHLGSATIRLSAMTGMSFFDLDDRITQIELSEGTLNIRVVRLDRDEIFEIDTPNQAFNIFRPGQYRIEASEDGNATIVTVRDGEGEVTGGGRTYSIGAGLTGSFTGGDTLRASIFKSGGYDEFDNWCRDRDHHDDGLQSRRYVSVEVVGYQDLDGYGYWQLDPGYGYIWIPRVSVGWAPYHDGHWVWISPWGWTWVDDAPWGFAPFHYGRWVNVGNYWGWVPGPIAVRPVYAPALVAFIGGPRFSVSVSVGSRGGYVGWFPLGPREVYVPAYNTSRAYVDRVNVSNTTVNNITITNVYNNTNSTNIRYSNKNVRGGVTAVSQTTFVSAQPVGRGAVAVNAQEIASAPINRRAEVAPTRNSVLGSATQSRVPSPPSNVINRSVVARTTPPPAPVPFERQQAKLAAQPGQPLAHTEIESLRSSNASPERSRFRKAPPAKPAGADSSQPTANPSGNVRSVTGPAQSNPPTSSGPSNALPPRDDRASRGGGNSGNRGPQQPSVQVPAPAPATGPLNPPVNNVPPARDDRPSNRGNRVPQQPSVQAPASVPSPGPAQSNPSSSVAPNNAPVSRDDRSSRGGGNFGNRGQQQPSVQAPATAAAPGPAQANPPAANVPPERGGTRGQQSQNNPAPSQSPATTVATPASSNEPPSRGRGR